ncbi:MAG: universal stress protein [Actinobacteria bacterium]|nr:universal stress protein [Actinomycetota bacterium]
MTYRATLRGLQRVLVGTDGSARAEEAVRQGARVARATGAALEVVFVHDPGLASAIDRIGGRDQRLRAEQVLAEASRIAGKEDVEAEVRWLVGHPPAMLVREAEERFADLLCVGADAGFAERPHLLGGVALRALRLARCPVLVARPAPEGTAGFPTSIVCGIDGSDGSIRAAREAAALASATGARLRLVHARPDRPGGAAAAARPSLPGALAEAELVARAAGLEPEAVEVPGDPAAALLRECAGASADVLVVGSRGLGGVSRLLLGSVSEQVVRRAPCSVLVVRHAHR